MTVNQAEWEWNHGGMSDEAMDEFIKAFNADTTKFTVARFEPGPCPSPHQRQLPRCGRIILTDKP